MRPHNAISSANGKMCNMCPEPASHKVEEVTGHATQYAHPFTAYLCCKCFGYVMGAVAVTWCNGEECE